MNIRFSADTSKVEVPDEFQGHDVLMVYRDGYDLPDIEVGERIEFAKFKGKYTSLTPRAMVLVGLNKIILPSNRCEMVFEFLQENSVSCKKFSIDRAPFVGEPWRFWFHYAMTGVNPWNFPHSYFVETLWSHWFFRDNDECNFDGAALRKLNLAAPSDLPKLETSFEFREPEVDEFERYEQAKEHAFTKHSTFKSIVNQMLKDVSLDKLSFDMYLQNQKFVVPDLRFFHFLKSENDRRMDIYNALIGY